MSITVLVRMTVKPGMEEVHVERLKAALPVTAKADGCLELIATRDMDRPNRFTIIERWTSREQYQAYVDWRVSTGSLEAMKERLEAPLEFTYLETFVSAVP